MEQVSVLDLVVFVKPCPKPYDGDSRFASEVPKKDGKLVLPALHDENISNG
jgi:hypothetical protein